MVPPGWCRHRGEIRACCGRRRCRRDAERRPSEAEQNHRERLFGAMVAKVAEQGYEATTVADLVDSPESPAALSTSISSTSMSASWRRSRRFSDPRWRPCPRHCLRKVRRRRRRCDAARIPGAADEGLIAARSGNDVPCGGLRRGLRGGRPARPRYGLSEDVARRVLDGMGREGMPSEIVRALIGGVQKVTHKRLYQGKPKELPDLAPQLWEWLLLYPPPPGPLRGPRRRVLRPLPFEERQAAAHPSERLLRALAAVVAEKGYPETTITDIIERAGMSYRAFYERFDNKEDAIVAALDVGSLQMLAAALPAFRRAKDWADAVRDTQEAMFLYGVQEPEYARLGAVEMYAAGKRALTSASASPNRWRRCWRQATKSPPTSRRLQPRRSAGALRPPLLRPREAEGPRAPWGTGALGRVRHPDPIHRR